MSKLILIGMVLTILSCTDKPDDVKRTLQRFDMKLISVDGFTLDGCGNASGNRTKFIATDHEGKAVQGVLCTGKFIDTTIIYQP